MSSDEKVGLLPSEWRIGSTDLNRVLATIGPDGKVAVASDLTVGERARLGAQLDNAGIVVPGIGLGDLVQRLAETLAVVTEEYAAMMDSEFGGSNKDETIIAARTLLTEVQSRRSGP